MLKSKSMRTYLTLAGGLALGSLLLAAPASAGTATTNLSVTATVANNCTISSAPVDFGAYDPVDTNSASPLDSTGTLTVTCTDGASATITLGQGANADAGSTDAAPARRMTDGTNFLTYSLSQDTPGGTVWGNTAGTGVAHSGTGVAQNHTVQGRVDAGQNVPAGSYTDTVVATVTF